MALRVLLVLLLTPLLAIVSGLAFIIVGGYDALQGPSVLQASWPLIYLLLIVLVGLLCYVVGRLVGGRLGGEALAIVIVLAWLGQLVALALGLVPTELQWTDFVAKWALLTGGPIQPTAAIAGALIGLGSATAAEAAA